MGRHNQSRGSGSREMGHRVLPPDDECDAQAPKLAISGKPKPEIRGLDTEFVRLPYFNPAQLPLSPSGSKEGQVGVRPQGQGLTENAQAGGIQNSGDEPPQIRGGAFLHINISTPLGSGGEL